MLIYLLLGLVFYANALAAPTSSSMEFLTLAGIPQHKIDQLDEGEIITHDIPESSDKEFGILARSLTDLTPKMQVIFLITA